jgi:hypothetical protein
MSPIVLSTVNWVLYNAHAYPILSHSSSTNKWDYTRVNVIYERANATLKPARLCLNHSINQFAVTLSLIAHERPVIRRLRYRI